MGWYVGDDMQHKAACRTQILGRCNEDKASVPLKYLKAIESQSRAPSGRTHGILLQKNFVC